MMSIESEIIELINDELKGHHEIELLESKVDNLISTTEELEGSVAEIELNGKDFAETWQFEEVRDTLVDVAGDVRKLEGKLATVVSEIESGIIDSESEIRRLVDKRMAELLMEMQLSISSVRLSIVIPDLSFNTPSTTSKRSSSTL